MYAKINLVRQRVGMPAVDQTKYGTKDKLRELIRRERSVEFAGEGLRRADILRWKGADGKMISSKLEDLYPFLPEEEQRRNMERCRKMTESAR